MIKNLKKQIETIFIQFTNFVYDNPIKILIVILGLIGFLAYQTLFIKINTSSEALLLKNDPELLQYNEFKEQFGRPERIIIMINTDEIFEPEFLNTLRSFHKALEDNIPYVSSVTSLTNIRDIRFENFTLVTKGFLHDWPGTNLNKLKLRAEASQLYKNFILSENGNATAVIIETLATIGKDNHFLGAKENKEIVLAVNSVVKEYNRPGFVLTPSGSSIIEEAFNIATLSDLRTCVTLSLIAVTFFLIILFKRFSGVFLSMMITIFTLTSTMGLLAVFNLPVKITTTVVPAFIVAVSVAASVHILVIFFRHHKITNDKKEAISFAMGHSGLPILITSLTTAAGLLSFSLAELAAIAEIGYLSAAGVILAFIYTIFMLPAVLALIPIKKSTPATDSPLMDSLLESTARFSYNHPYTIIWVSGILFIFSVFCLFNLTFSHNIIQFFPDSSKEKQDIIAIDKAMKGSLSLELVIKSKKTDAFDLVTLNLIDEFSEEIKKLKVEGISVGKIFSINDVIKETNQAFNNESPLFYSIPQNPLIITSSFAMLEKEAGNDLKKLIHKDSGLSRITVVTTWTDAVVCMNFISRIEQKFNQVFKNGSELTVTGLMALLARAINAAIFSMVKSYAAAFIVVAIMMILLLGSLKLGLVSMVPNLLPIFIILGLMGFLNVPFDLNSLMIGSIALGLVVDDTVHFMYNFQKQYDDTHNAEHAIFETITGTGKAMLITSLVLSTGFFVLVAASLNHVVRFGVFTGLTILVALLGDFLLAPALMVVINKKRNK
ncbi:MAG: MMPL family transporter [Desulfobacteraceae bacterium]|nr:MMPL family transporter [Desulfobacteraceae bacterium]